MSEKMRYCPACEKLRLHCDWKEGPDGDRASAAERLMFGAFTLGFSELVMTRWRKCLSCGYKRQP